MNSEQRSVVKYFLRHYWRAYTLLFILSGLVALLDALHVGLMYVVLNFILGGGSPATLGRVGNALNGALALAPFEDKMIAGCVFLLALTPAKGLLSVIYEFFIAWTSGRVLYRTKKNILEKYSRAPYQFFLDHKQGELLQNVITAPTRLGFMLTRLPQLVIEALRIIGILAILLAINVPITLGLGAMGLTLNFLMGAISRKVSYNMGKGRVEASAEQTTLFTEWVSGIKHIKLYEAKAWWLGRFDAASRRFNELFVKDAALLAMPKNLIETFAMTGLFGTLLALRLRAPGELLSNLPIAGTFCMALLKILPSLSIFSRGRMEIMGSLADVEGIHAAMHAEFPPLAGGSTEFAGLKREIRFSAVCFGYSGRPATLQGVDFSVERGKTLAIVGGSGSGKTTVLNLLLGLYRPDSGAITVDGVPLEEYSAASWLGRLAVVSQDSFIFHGTIDENIRFGRDSFSQAEVERAARLAHAHDFIAALPQGYRTLVGERGMKLSGGQQQRLSIARAMLGDPEILLFDEATSSLDSVSETAVQKAIQEVSRGRTVIQIAHRLSTIQDADKIVVLHEGKVVEEGRHSELLDRGGRYADFYAKHQDPA